MRLTEFVDGEKKSLKDGYLEEFFGRKVIEESFSGKDENGTLNDDFKVLERYSRIRL